MSGKAAKIRLTEKQGFEFWPASPTIAWTRVWLTGNHSSNTIAAVSALAEVVLGAGLTRNHGSWHFAMHFGP